MTYRPWTSEEIGFLKENYMIMTHQEIRQKLGRSEKAVRNKCWKLNLKKFQYWTPEEDELLRELYTKYPETCFIDSIAKELKRTKAAVACRANELGLTRKCRPHAKEHVLNSVYRSKRRFFITKNGLGISTNGGYREDIGIYVRSTWEANYARYLNWLIKQGEVSKWEYEADTFEFPVKRGTRFYTPDFKVILPNGTVEYHEVKGYMSQRGKTALKRMEKYYPHVKIVLIDGNAYREIRRKLGRVIPGWEDAPKMNIWTTEQERQLSEMWQAGVPTKEIAAKLGRTENSIIVRAQRLGLRRPSWTGSPRGRR